MLKCHYLVSGCLLCLPLYLSGCLAQQDVRFDAAKSSFTLSENSQLSFAYLQIEQAMQRGELDNIMEAGETLLRLRGDMRPVGDAAAWLLNSKHAVEAQSLLERAIPLAPEDAVLRTMLADALLEQGKTEEARSFVRDYVKKHPHDVQARLDLALLYLKTGANSEALKELERLPESIRTPAVLYYEAQACRSLNRPDQAARLLRRALQKSPDFLEAMLELASIEEQLNHHAAARKLYEKLMTFDEGNQDILTRLVALSLKEGNPDRAFELASSMPDSMSFILTASALFLDEGRFDLAENLLATLAERPDAPEELLFYQAAVAYEGHRDAVRTLELLERISPSNRYYDRALKLRAQVLYENGNVDQALDVIRKGREIFPSDKDFVFFAIDLLGRQKRYEEAGRVAEKALHDWPSDADLAFQRAFLKDMAGKRDEAMRLMEELLRANPDNAAVLNYIGYTLAEENRDLPRALKLLTRAVELSPGTDYMLDSLAWAYYQAGDYSKAWELIREAVKHMSASTNQDPTMWEHYGDIARAYGRSDNARQGWERALELRPKEPDVIRKKLENLQ